MLLIGGPLDGQYHPRPIDGRKHVVIVEREPLPRVPLGPSQPATVETKQHIYRVEKLTADGDDMSFYCHDKLTVKKAFERLFESYAASRT